MKETRYKYPRTFHFPWSDSVMGDDHIFTEFENLIGKEVVVTEKMDGENTNIYIRMGLMLEVLIVNITHLEHG